MTAAGEREIVEKVARALAYRSLSLINMAHPTRSEEELARAVDAAWRLHADYARIAIEAMREPSEAMLEAADRHTAMMPDTKAEFATLYRHMIDAALHREGFGVEADG